MHASGFDFRFFFLHSSFIAMTFLFFDSSLSSTFMRFLFHFSSLSIHGNSLPTFNALNFYFICALVEPQLEWQFIFILLHLIQHFSPLLSAHFSSTPLSMGHLQCVCDMEAFFKAHFLACSIR